MRSAQRREWRQRVAHALGEAHDGVARRGDLLAEGLTTSDIEAEVRRGVWHRVGVHTLAIVGRQPQGRGLLWWALWESGPRAVLDGTSALVAAGLEGWSESQVQVSVPRNATVRQLPGVRHHVLRDLGPRITVGLRRTKPEVAVIRSGQWAVSDRAAATVMAMAVQQRLVPRDRLLERWAGCRRSPRRALLDAVIRDICDGAHSITELDVARACRARGLPPPTRQAVRQGAQGKVYLDLWWEDHHVHVEVQGAHHLSGLTGVDDAIRSNGIALQDRDVTSLQVPVLGWRLQPGVFLDQIEAALVSRGWQRP